MPPRQVCSWPATHQGQNARVHLQPQRILAIRQVQQRYQLDIGATPAAHRGVAAKRTALVHPVKGDADRAAQWQQQVFS